MNATFRILVLSLLLSRLAVAGNTARVSVDSAGVESDDRSQCAALSGDGRFVVFESMATTLVPNDTNGTFDIFVHDRQTGVTERVSVASDGTEGNHTSYASNDHGADLSADGRFVAFESGATNLVGDIFVHDRDTGATERVSVASDGTEANGYSFEPSISANGQFVVFQSWAANLVTGDTNASGDILVHDRLAGTTERVSVATDGSEGNDNSYNGRISADGRFVTFSSLATNLVTGDTNAFRDVFVHDRQTGATQRVSVASDGSQADDWSLFPRISDDGRFVAFTSPASTLVAGDTNGTYDIFVHDRVATTTTRVSVASDGSQGNWFSYRVDISADGRFVAFHSAASNLVDDDSNGQEDVFVRDRRTDTTARVSVASDGAESNGNSLFPSISSDGRFITFHSLGDTLVSGDTNVAWDVFVHDPEIVIFGDGFESSDITPWSAEHGGT